MSHADEPSLAATALKSAHERSGRKNVPKGNAPKGLLVIHGAGHERQSGTIRFMGSPLIDWVRRWVEDHDRTLRVNQTALRLGPTDDNVNQPPPYVHITLGTVDDDGDSPVGTEGDGPFPSAKQRQVEPFSWIMTEAWWAWSSIDPPLLKLFMWLVMNFMRAVWDFLCTQVERVRKLWPEILRQPPDKGLAANPFALWVYVALCALMLAVSPVVVLLGIVGLVAVTLLSQVPIDAVRKSALVGPVASFLTINGGQMFTLANDEVQAANFRGRLERAIRFLQNQGCNEIYIMGHSAGCVVAYETLCTFGDIWQRYRNPSDPSGRRLRPPPVVKLFTMGEGLNLDWRLQPRKWWKGPHQWRLFVPLQDKIHWVDFWAGHDPVPSGPIATGPRAGPFPRIALD